MSRRLLILCAALGWAATQPAAAEQCGVCHPESRVEYVESVHAREEVTCAACHGVDGRGTTPLFPNLNGQKAEYLAHQLTIAGLCPAQLIGTGATQIRVGVLAEFCLPLIEQVLGDTFDVVDATADSSGTVLTVLEFRFQIAVLIFEVTASIVSDGNELLECRLELYLGLLLGVARVLDAVHQDIAFFETEALHGAVIRGLAAGHQQGERKQENSQLHEWDPRLRYGQGDHGIPWRA